MNERRVAASEGAIATLGMIYELELGSILENVLAKKENGFFGNAEDIRDYLIDRVDQSLYTRSEAKALEVLLCSRSAKNIDLEETLSNLGKESWELDLVLMEVAYEYMFDDVVQLLDLRGIKVPEED